MRLAVTGSRDWTDESLLRAVLTNTFRCSPGTVELHVGDARGADTQALRWARLIPVTATVYTADWQKHGKAAGAIRNRAMLDQGKPELLVAFKRGADSRGTDDCIKAARQRGVPVLLIQHGTEAAQADLVPSQEQIPSLAPATASSSSSHPSS